MGTSSPALVNMDQEVQQTCRLCTQIGWDYIPIFGSNNFTLVEKINRCLPIIVLSTDELPLYMCKKCLCLLNTSYELIVCSLKAETILRRKLAEAKEINYAIRNKLGCADSNSIIVKVDSEKILSAYDDGSNHNTKDLIICDLCEESFNNMDVFDNHMERNHLLQWRCNLCDSSFKNLKDLTTHEKTNHVENTTLQRYCFESNSWSDDATDADIVYSTSIDTRISSNDTKSKPDPYDLTCNICKVNVENPHLLAKHKTIHSPRTIRCNTCREQCCSAYDLFLHKQDEHNIYKRLNLRYVCDMCDKFFSTSSQWECHVKVDCPKKFPVHVCKYCTATFSTKHKLTCHLRKHKDEMLEDPDVTVYKCVACPKVFVDKDFYQKHRNVHDPECWDKFKCPICNRSFRDRLRLREHQQSIHEGVKLHQCDICGRRFHRLYNMKVHRMKHVDHKCSQCEEVFHSLHLLSKHTRASHKLKVNFKTKSRKGCRSGCYVCKFCGKQLATSQSILDHEHIHTGERPYHCNVCSKSFRSYTARWAHAQRHVKGNFVCEHCGKCFSFKQNLRTHIQIHMPIEKRKHQCSKCGKRFLRKTHLNIHMRIHDGVRPYTCDICLFRFTQLGDMRRHRARHAYGEIRMRKSKKKPPPTFCNVDSP